MTLNGVRKGDAIAYFGPNGEIFLEEAALKHWQILVPEDCGADHRGAPHGAGVKTTRRVGMLDVRLMEVQLTVPAQLFVANAVMFARQGEIILSPPPWAGFLNYDLFGYWQKQNSYGAGLFEAGISGPYGSGIATFAANNSQANGGTSGHLLRYETCWRYDDPVAARTLIIGDTMTRAGAWGNAVRFGGIQVGTNFSLQPNLITYPLQAVSGTAVVPSTVDIFVNGQKTGSQEVPPGPFTINNVPVVTGSGDVQLVIRDAFGQQQLISQPFYASRTLLAPGLIDYTVSAGAIRQNYGVNNFDYSSALASAYWRHGVNDHLTYELRAEGDHTAQSAGGAVDFMPGNYGLFTLGGAGSHANLGNGYAVLAGYQYQSPVVNVAVRGWWGSNGFQTLGTTHYGQLQRQLLASAGYNFGADGTLALAWATQQYRGMGNSGNAAVTYSTAVARNLFFSLSVSKGVGSGAQDGIFATLTLPLTALDTLSAEVNSTRLDGKSTTQGNLTLQRPLPVGEGWGYRVRAASNSQYDAGAGYSGAYGKYGLEIGQQGSSTAVRGDIAGGIGTVGGAVFLARPIVDSFAVVRIDDVPDVRVYQNGNYAGKTDASGKVILTQLMPYMDTRITVEDQDVPIDITLKTNEQRVAPYYRSGVIADFAARRVVNASLEVRLPNNKPLPTGAEVHLTGKDLAYPVGNGGEVFISDLVYGSVYVADWAGGRCSFSIKVDPIPTEPMPNLGKFVCRSGLAAMDHHREGRLLVTRCARWPVAAMLALFTCRGLRPGCHLRRWLHRQQYQFRSLRPFESQSGNGVDECYTHLHAYQRRHSKDQLDDGPQQRQFRQLRQAANE